MQETSVGEMAAEAVESRHMLRKDLTPLGPWIVIAKPNGSTAIITTFARLCEQSAQYGIGSCHYDYETCSLVIDWGLNDEMTGRAEEHVEMPRPYRVCVQAGTDPIPWNRIRAPKLLLSVRVTYEEALEVATQLHMGWVKDQKQDLLRKKRDLEAELERTHSEIRDLEAELRRVHSTIDNFVLTDFGPF